MAKVHYWELSNYNSGRLIGKWFELDGVSKEDHLQELTDWLEELTASTGELCEEWILGDVDDVPDSMHWEYGICDAFFEAQEKADETGKPVEALIAGAACGFTLDDAAEKYAGQLSDAGNYKDLKDWCQECSPESDSINELLQSDEIPECIRLHFDWDSWSRELEVNDYCESDGYVFRNY
jgi:antirestriction protein